MQVAPYVSLFSHLSDSFYAVFVSLLYAASVPHWHGHLVLYYYRAVYAFLVTLVLLLGVSAAIVVRPLPLRRRRMIADAIANGTWMPPAPHVRVDFRKRPRMWDAAMATPVVSGVIGK
ncbi:hypothetical protein B0H13DRAFT_2672328 [Mycena leptocephala]|nr:hypothetical protein B0H13DRAFT_2672328 [Mycena leptocephala]